VEFGSLRSHEQAIHTVQRLADLFLIAAIYPIVNRVYHQHWTPESATLVLTAILMFTVAAEMCSLYRPWRVERFRVEIRTVFLTWTMTVATLVLIGLIVGIGLAFLIDYLDQTVRTREEAERLLQMPVLGEIPRHSTRKGAAA